MVDEEARDGDVTTTNVEGEILEGRLARVEPTASLNVVLSVGDLGPVVVDNVLGEEEQRGTRVDNTLDVLVTGMALADGVTGGVETPVALALVEAGVVDFIRVLAVINVTEVVSAVCK